MFETSLSAIDLGATTKLYLDDLRTPVAEGFVVVRSTKDAITHILKYGVPAFISFDHDLGIDQNGNLNPSGYDFAKWLVNADMEGLIVLPSHFAFKIHSQNPIGAKNIRMLLGGYLKKRQQI